MNCVVQSTCHVGCDNDDQQVSMICSICSRERNTTRLPRGWKRDGDSLYCEACWADRYVLRAIAMPVVEPISGSWRDFRSALLRMWELTTRASNWMMTQLYARDARRIDQLKMPPMPRIYLYPEARALFPGLPPRTIAALEHTVQRRYRASRRDVVWTAAASLPTVRYPAAFPISSQAWSITFDAGNRPVAKVTLGDQLWSFRLRGGPRYWRQLTALRQLIEGSAKEGEMALWKRPDGEIICKIVAWLPRTGPVNQLQGTLSVRSTADALLVAVDAKNERVWIYNADHVRRWSAEHARRLQRLSQDQKAETAKRPAFADRRRDVVQKYRNRMTSAVHEISASLANFAARRRYANVLYDDMERGFCPQFPWYELREKLEYKLNALGILLQRATVEASNHDET